MDAWNASFIKFPFGMAGAMLVSGRVSILFKQESVETEAKTAENMLVKESRGVFCAVKGSNLRNDELGHAST